MPQGPFEQVRREIEKLLGYPKGAFDPWSTFLRDSERINRALGQGFVRLEDILHPQDLLDKIQAGFEELAGSEVFQLPRRMYQIPPPPTDRRYRLSR